MTAPDRKYQGWSSYETWLVNLWITNDEGLYELAKEALGNRHAGDRPEDRLKDFVEELAQEGAEGFRLDLINSALAEVDWREIAGSLAEDSGDPEEGPEKEGAEG